MLSASAQCGEVVGMLARSCSHVNPPQPYSRFWQRVLAVTGRKRNPSSYFGGRRPAIQCRSASYIDGVLCRPESAGPFIGSISLYPISITSIMAAVELMVQVFRLQPCTMQITSQVLNISGLTYIPLIPHFSQRNFIRAGLLGDASTLHTAPP